MTDRKKLQVNVLGDAGELILGNKPQEVIEPNTGELQPASDFETGD